MAVSYETVDVPSPTLKKKLTARWIFLVVKNYQKKAGTITYIFCSDAEILKINEQYLNHNYYTDIITFDYTEDNVVSGDLFISLDRVKANSKKFGTDYEEELHRVMIHGILHLCGFKDKKSAEKQIMREKEDEALALLRKLY